MEKLLLFVIAVVYAGINYFFPIQSGEVYRVALDYLLEMALILPPVFILMGLFEVWVPREFVQKHLGKESGIKGYLFAFVLGTLPAGPIYVAFPVASTLIKKGAGIRNIVFFLGIWASAKLPQIMVEIKFLGLSFAAARFMLTILCMGVMGFVMEKLLTHDKTLLEEGLNNESY